MNRINSFAPSLFNSLLVLSAAVLAAALLSAPAMAQGSPAVRTGIEEVAAKAGVQALRQAATDRASSRAVELLSRYVRIDTVNPPGNESRGAQFLASVLEESGINARVFESRPGRGNVYARLRGDGSRRPVILLSHIDVVPADPEQWSVPPFEAVVKDGSLYGRGVLDCKGITTIQLLAMLALKESGTTLSRDIIFLATADEETGGRLGAAWMLDNHYDLLGDAEFVLNEGGFVHRDPGKPLVFKLGVAEKNPCWFRVIATGEPGHGSRPAAETAVTRLVDALAKLTAREKKIEVVPVVAGYYAAYAALDEEHARQYRQLERSLESAEFRDWFMADPAAAALVTDTVAPTMLEGSVKTNIIPATATAQVDSRLLPGHDCVSFLSELRQLVGGPNVRIEPILSFASTQSPMNNELTEAVERVAAAMDERAIVLPALLGGFTDSHYFREKGIHAYGMVPLETSPEERSTLHGPDERVSVSSLQDAVGRMVDLLLELGG